MSEAGSSVRCGGCGLLNWASDGVCKRCGSALGARNEPATGVWQPPAYRDYSPRPAAKGAGGGGSSGALRKLIVLAIVVAALGGAYRVGRDRLFGPSWRDFKLESCNFSVRMPAHPKVDTTPLVAEGEIPWMGADAELWGKEACSAKFAVIPFLQTVGDEQLAQAALGAAGATGSTVLAKRPVAFDGGRAIELEMKPPDKLMTDGRAYMRVYLVGPRVYVLMLVGHENGRLVRERNEFFDSFKLLQKKLAMDSSG